jgi:hypothetical protein
MYVYPVMSGEDSVASQEREIGHRISWTHTVMVTESQTQNGLTTNDNNY